VGSVLSGQIADEVACRDVPHFYCFVQAGAQQSRVVLQQQDCPNEIQMPRHSLQAGRTVFFSEAPHLYGPVCTARD